MFCLDANIAANDILNHRFYRLSVARSQPLLNRVDLRFSFLITEYYVYSNWLQYSLNTENCGISHVRFLNLQYVA